MGGNEMITTEYYDRHRKDLLNLGFDLEYYHFDSDEFVYKYEATFEDFAEYVLSEMRIPRRVRSNVEYKLIMSLYKLGWFDKLLEDEYWHEGFYDYLLDEKEGEARKAYEEQRK